MNSDKPGEDMTDRYEEMIIGERFMYRIYVEQVHEGFWQFGILGKVFAGYEEHSGVIWFADFLLS